MQRFIVFDRQLQPLFDLDGRVTEAMRYERINGEHKLDVKTTQQLEEGLRMLIRDGTLGWREWVVDEPDEHKADADIVEGSYGYTWSIQYDLSTVSGGELWPGTYTPITAGAALAMVLGVQSRWEVGNVTVSGTAGTSLFDGSVWDYLGKLQEVWGGEIEPRIEVDSNGVTHRYVDWLAHVGSTEATRRFDYGEDCTSIDRKPPVGPMCCRIIPRGGHDATDEDGISYSERVGVEEEPYSSGDGWVHDAGSIWVRDPDAEQVFRTPNPDGTWHYPELVVTYDTDDPEELLQLASDDIHKYTRPVPTYEADVLQFAAAGMDAHGVQLGDVVHIVDRKFGDAPLRIEARIVEMTVNELDESDVRLVIGEAKQGIESAFKSMRSAIDAAEERTRRIEGGGTIVYLQHLLDEINAEINGTGGYSYLVPGEGIVTYDRRVADPLIGTEATQVTQIKGGNIRIANSKKASFSGINDWNWKTVIVSGHIAAELVTAANIVAGYIGNASAGSYWDLDNNELRIATGAQIGETTVSDLLQDVASAGINKIEYGTSSSSSTAPTSWSTTVPSSVAKGSWLWIRTTYKDGGTSTTKAYAGEDGVGVKSIVPQYYLSTSSTSATGGSWSNNPPTWSANHYIWTRSYITWDTTPSTTSTTTAIYDAALTQANQKAAQAIADAAEAAKVATNYLTFDSTNGLSVGYSGTYAKTQIKGNGVEVLDGNGDSSLFAGLQNGNSVVRVGLSDKTRAEIDYHSMKLVDKEGNAFFYVSDLRDSSGKGTVVEQHVLEDHDPSVWDRATIDLVLNAVNTNYTVTRNGVAITSGIYKYKTYFSVLNSANPRNGDKFVVTYQTDSVYAKAFTMGVRLANSRIGVMSMAEGRNCVASEAYSHAEGMSSSATAYSAHAEGGIVSNGSLTRASTASASAAHAEGGSTASGVASHSEGYNTTASGLAAHSQGRSATASGRSSHAGGEGCTASGDYSHAEGHSTTASGEASAAFGTGTKASRKDQFVCGRYNYDRQYGLFAVGYGPSSDVKSNIFDCSYNKDDMGSAAIRMFGNVAGTVYVNGQSVHSSDKRLKDHVAYLEDDASDFIRALKPIRYKWKSGGGEHYGFYAQDVQDADPHDTETVIESEKNEELGFTPLSLDYTAIIAPLVAYAQQLERRIDQQQQAIEALTKRLDALEGR